MCVMMWRVCIFRKREYLISAALRNKLHENGISSAAEWSRQPNLEIRSQKLKRNIVKCYDFISFSLFTCFFSRFGPFAQNKGVIVLQHESHKLVRMNQFNRIIFVISRIYGGTGIELHVIAIDARTPFKALKENNCQIHTSKELSGVRVWLHVHKWSGCLSRCR